MNKEILSQIRTPDAPRAVASYGQGVILDRGGRRHEVVTSGQIAFDPQTKKLIDGGVGLQTEQVLKNVGAILDAGGAKPGDVYQTDVVITDPAHFGEFNDTYQDWEYIRGQEVLPTRFTSVGGLLFGGLVEVRAHALFEAPSRFRTVFDLGRHKK
jgi:2-iminobutanoate/2-iminopropanoate deaminase